MENTLRILLSSFLRITAELSPKLSANLAWLFFCRPRIRKKSLSKSETELIQQSEQLFINSGEHRIAVYQWQTDKDADIAKTILFTHGWGGHALNFYIHC